MTDRGSVEPRAPRLEVEQRDPQTKVELMTGNPKADRSSRAEPPREEPRD